MAMGKCCRKKAYVLYMCIHICKVPPFVCEHKRKYDAIYYVSELSPLEVPTVLAIENAGNSHTNTKKKKKKKKIHTSQNQTLVLKISLFMVT